MKKSYTKIPLFWPYIPKKKILKELKDTLNTRWIGQGPKVDLFEKRFGEKFGYKYPLFVNSGSAALELAYHLIDIKKGNEIITSVLTCTATNIPLLRKGAKIIFADIDKETLNISYEDIKRKLTNKTKAVVVVTLGGIDIDRRIYSLCKKHKISLVIDAAQSLGLKSRADYICYSFQAIKHITTADGGMLILNNKKNYERAKLLRWFGIDRGKKAKENWQAWRKRKMTFDIYEAGYKYQPTDIDASFGFAGLEDFDKVMQHRKRLVEEYKKLLPKDIKCIYGNAIWLFGILTEDRDNLADFLLENGIEVNLVHLRNDIFNIFKKYKTNCPNMDWVESRYLYLPINLKVTKKDVYFITQKIKEFFNRA